MAKRTALFILFVIFSFFQVTAQDASIHGIIKGEDTNEGLVGVNILIKGTVQGTISGNHGDYILHDIPPGQHTLIFSYIGDSFL